MGKMKEKFIDQINKDRNGPDDTDWNAPTFDGAGFSEEDRLPKPVSEQPDGKKLWIVKSTVGNTEYRIWAYTYQQALELLPMIESF